MVNYDWNEYDARTDERQTIHNASNIIDIMTKFVKILCDTHEDSWNVQVKNTSENNVSIRLISMMLLYADMKDFESLNVKNKKNDLSIKDDVMMKKSSNELRNFTLDVLESERNRHLKSTHLEL